MDSTILEFELFLGLLKMLKLRPALCGFQPLSPEWLKLSAATWPFCVEVSQSAWQCTDTSTFTYGTPYNFSPQNLKLASGNLALIEC